MGGTDGEDWEEDGRMGGRAGGKESQNKPFKERHGIPDMWVTIFDYDGVGVARAAG